MHTVPYDIPPCRVFADVEFDESEYRLQVYDIEKLEAGVPRTAWNAHAAHVTALCCVRPPAVALLSAATNGTIGYWDLRKKPSKPAMAWSQPPADGLKAARLQKVTVLQMVSDTTFVRPPRPLSRPLSRSYPPSLVHDLHVHAPVESFVLPSSRWGASHDSITNRDLTCVQSSMRIGFAWCMILSRRPPSEATRFAPPSGNLTCVESLTRGSPLATHR